MIREHQHWILYYRPGAFMGDTWSVDQDGFILPTDVAWPKDAYAFSQHQRIDLVDDDGARYKGEARQVGPLYYHPDSQVQTLEQVERDPRRTAILIENMRGNKWDRIIWSRWGNWAQPSDPERVMVLPHSSPEGP